MVMMLMYLRPVRRLHNNQLVALPENVFDSLVNVPTVYSRAVFSIQPVACTVSESVVSTLRILFLCSALCFFLGIHG